MTTNNAAPASDTMRAVLLVYDIPSSCPLPNPSGKLRHFAVRINLSCWVMPDYRLPSVPFAEWREKGVKTEVLHFDERESAKVIEMARASLRREAVAMLQYIETGVSRVRRDAEALEINNAKGLKKVQDAASRHVRKAREFAEAAEECALTFKVIGEIKPLVDNLRTVIRAKAELYKAAVAVAQDRFSGQLKMEGVA